MGTVFLAEPVCDDIHASLPLELYVTVFNSEYYLTSQGQKEHVPRLLLLLNFRQERRS